MAFLKKLFQFLYKPETLGISYRGKKKTITTKAILESLGAVLALFAAYSDLSQRFVEFLPVSLSPYSLTIGRFLTGILGVFVCGHILLSTEPMSANDPRRVFSYGKLPRWVASALILCVLAGLGFATYDLFHTPTPYDVGAHAASLEMPSSAWQLEKDPTTPGSENRTYRSKILIPNENKVDYRHLMISVIANQGYEFIDVFPHTSKTVPESQQQLKTVGSNNGIAMWFFPVFDQTLEWQLSVTVARVGPDKVFSEQFPFQATIYFSK